MGQDRLGNVHATRRGVLAAAGAAAVGVGMAAPAMAAPAVKSGEASTEKAAVNGIAESHFLSGWGGNASVEFNVTDMLAQGGQVCDLFVATGSTSPVILVTGGAVGSAAVSPWHATNHVVNILAQPFTQGGRPGVRLRINFVGDSPSRGTVQRVSIFQAGATYFSSPERTTGVPQ